MPNQPPLKWPLPTEVHPTGVRCFQVPVPDERAYIGAFLGAIFLLTKPYAWQNDVDHTALEVGAVWREIFDNLVGCSVFDVRTDPTNSCILQKFDSDLGEWVDFADISDCIASNFPPDNPPGRSQPGPNSGGPTPAADACYDYDLELKGNGMVLVPVAIHAGYTITVSNSDGAIQTDGVALFDWLCPTGENFLAGICSGTPSNESGDPMPSEAHGSIIMALPDGTFTTMADGVAYTVPDTMVDGNYVLQVNDETLSDNLGSFTFHLQVCNNTPCANITYLLGATGPDRACVGDEFDYNVTVFDGSVWNGGIVFDRCCTLTLVSQSGAIVTSADHNDCDGSGHAGFDTTDVTKIGTNSSIGTFTLHFRLDSVI